MFSYQQAGVSGKTRWPSHCQYEAQRLHPAAPSLVGQALLLLNYYRPVATCSPPLDTAEVLLVLTPVPLYTA